MRFMVVGEKVKALEERNTVKAEVARRPTTGRHTWSLGGDAALHPQAALASPLRV